MEPLPEVGGKPPIHMNSQGLGIAVPVYSPHHAGKRHGSARSGTVGIDRRRSRQKIANAISPRFEEAQG
ncbi:MAG TPA: hypothetical protein VLZ56_08940, partial [Mycoplana sp.]|nr:hypothetical protein [Mycoplana sp.]